MKRTRTRATPRRPVTPRFRPARTTAPRTAAFPTRTRTRSRTRLPRRTLRGRTVTFSRLRAAPAFGGGAHELCDAELPGTIVTAIRSVAVHATIRSRRAPAAERIAPPWTLTA